MAKQRVLITGGAGFLGSHLCEKFLNEDYEVIVMDNLLTSTIDNVSHLFGHDNFTFIKYNVVNYIYVEGKIDLILHFACPASPIDYIKHPIHTMKVDSLGTLNSLGLAKNKKSRYIFASTSEIYGSAQIHPQKESYWGNVNPVGPRSVYDEAKRFSEAMSMAYHREYDIDVRIARIFNTYGPNMRPDDGRVISSFIVNALKNKPLEVFGDGLQTRSFCYVDDLIEGIFGLSVHENLNGEIFNLGNPEEIKIIDLAKLIIEITGSKSEIINKQLPEDDPPVRKPDIDKANKIINWYPKTELKEGLNKTVKYFKKILKF
jgi:dTDP-glucose 4,6-dehydratase